MSLGWWKKGNIVNKLLENQTTNMLATVVSVFFITLLTSFLGTLPFGPINLSMVDVTLRNSLRAGLWFSIAAALVEMVQSVVALYGSSWLSKMMVDGPWLKILGFAIFVVLGLVFYFKKTQDPNDAELQERCRKKGSHFINGLIISLLNPQAIPFWIIVLAFLHSAEIMSLNQSSPLPNIVSFLFGAALGKLGALMVFGIMSQTVISRASTLRENLNRIIGVILIVIGVMQAVLALTA